MDNRLDPLLVALDVVLDGTSSDETLLWALELLDGRAPGHCRLEHVRYVWRPDGFAALGLPKRAYSTSSCRSCERPNSEKRISTSSASAMGFMSSLSLATRFKAFSSSRSELRNRAQSRSGSRFLRHRLWGA